MKGNQIIIKLTPEVKSVTSLIIGMFTIAVLTFSLSLYADEDNFFRFLIPLKDIVYPLIGGTLWEFSSFFILPLSFLGIILGFQGLKSSKKRLSIIGIVFSLIGLIGSLFTCYAIVKLAAM